MFFTNAETENLRLLLSGVFVGLCGLQDLRTRKIRLPFLAAAGCTALAFDFYLCMCGGSDPVRCAASLLPGAFLLVPAFAADGAAGKADGICFMILGAFMGGRQTLLVLLTALFLAAACSILLLSLRRVDKKTRLPFLVFAAASWAGMLVFQKYV